MRREPEVPEEKVPVVECLDYLARITTKELATTRSVKSGTLQNACTTRPRVVVGLERSAHSHIVRLMNSRQKGCAGQAADAVSTYTQVKMEDAPSLLKIPMSECPDIRIRLPRHKWPKSLSSIEDPVVLLERKLVRSSSGNTIVGKAI